MTAFDTVATPGARRSAQHPPLLPPTPLAPRALRGAAAATAPGQRPAQEVRPCPTTS
jgi:hypothetical protein